jgi:hypothetical protein
VKRRPASSTDLLDACFIAFNAVSARGAAQASVRALKWQ